MSQEVTRPTDRPFVPALAYPRLTGVYDRLAGLWSAHARFVARLVEEVNPPPGGRVLDVGCGAGAVALGVKRQYPAAEVTGIDPDPAILAAARAKAAQQGAAVTLVEATATALPFPDGSFDRVASCLVFHHLDRATKQAAFREAWRVLTPGGQLHLADFDRPHNWLMRAGFLAVRLLDGFTPTADNAHGRLPDLGREAKFVGWERTTRFATLLGTVCLFRAVKPATGGEGVPC